MAKEKGYYKDVGLDVEIKEYQHGLNIVNEVLNGKSNYGVSYPSIILDKTEQKDIVLLAALLQSSPHVLLSLKSSKIQSVKDFKNKKIMIAGEATYTTSFISMFSSNGIKISDMIRLEPNCEIDSLINGDVDLITAYRTNELYQLKKEDIAYNVWDPKNYGFDFYDDILFTSRDELDKHPERVEHFRQATLKGVEYAYAHVDETVALILAKYNTQDKSEEALLHEAYTLKDLAYMNKKPLGDIDKTKVQRIVDIYNLFGQIKSKINLDEFIYNPKSNFYLTSHEKEYLLKKRNITMCIDPNWMPFEKFEGKKYIGMSADYFKLVSEKLPVKITVIPTKSWEESVAFAKERKCDIMSLVMATPKRKEYLNFTDPYLKIPLVMATKIDAPFITNFASLKNKRVGIAKGYAFLELLKLKYPTLDIVEVENLQDGLQKVINGSIYGYIGTLASIGYSFQKNFTGELKIAGKFDGSWDLGIGVRSDDTVLLHVLQKIILSIDEKEKQKILNDWLAINYEKSLDYTIVFEIVAGFILMLLLVTFFYFRERKLKKDAKINEALLEAIMNNIPNPMFYKDRAGVFQDLNRAFSEDILGLKKEQIIGKTLNDLKTFIPLHIVQIHEQQDAMLYKNHLSQEYESSAQMADGSFKNYKITKTIFTSDAGECLGYVGIMSDITELKTKEKKLEKLASVDPLTKLYNRRYFSKMANHLLNLAKRDKENLALVMMDIDDFKTINDSYGHKIGDDVIVVISNILLTMSRESDIVCRFGGEEFLMLLPKTDITGAAIIAEKMRAKVEELRLSVDKNQEIKFTMSLGISEVEVGSEKDIERAIKRADDALYNAKRSGKNRVCYS